MAKGVVGSKLITKQMPWHANMTELNHLGKALIAKPDKFESKIGQLFTAERYSDNPLTAMAKRFFYLRRKRRNRFYWFYV